MQMEGVHNSPLEEAQPIVCHQYALRQEKMGFPDTLKTIPASARAVYAPRLNPKMQMESPPR